MADRDLPLKNPEARRKVPRERAVPKQRALTKAEKRELVDYFKDRVAQLDVRATTKTARGQILDWIDVASQHPKGQIATPPPDPQLSTSQLRGRRTRMA